MLRITFINDGTGSEEVGNYDYIVSVNLYQIARGRVEGHIRADGWEGLIKLFDDIISDDGTQKVNTRGENKA